VIIYEHCFERYLDRVSFVLHEHLLELRTKYVTKLVLWSCYMRENDVSNCYTDSNIQINNSLNGNQVFLFIVHFILVAYFQQ